jgi:hypothetical protein
MESRAFHICPFCQAQNPASVSRCVRCARSLAGLPLPVYGSDLDAEMRPNASADLVDLPLREAAVDAPGPDVAHAALPAVPATPPVGRPSQRRQPQTHDGGRGRRDGRTARLAIAAGMIGAAGLLGAAVLVGGWLVRAQDREDAPPATVATAPAPPDTTRLPAATSPVTAPPVTTSAPPTARPAPPGTVDRAVAPPVREASREESPSPRPRRPPAAEVITVRPDVAAAPVDVERARDDFDRDDPPNMDPGARATLRARLDRAQERRDVAAEHVRELRVRVNVPVIRDVAEYQRLQDELAAALDDLDQANVEVRRFRRALRRAEE